MSKVRCENQKFKAEIQEGSGMDTGGKLMVVSLLGIIFTVSHTRAAEAPQEAISSHPSSNVEGSSPKETCDVFGGMAASLLETITHMPPRLPSHIPGCRGKDRPHASLVVAVSSHYEIELEWDKDCQGAKVCYYGTVQASSSPRMKELGKGVRVPVTLNGGIRGSFVPPDCYSGECSSSSIVWSEGGYYYSVGLVGQEKEILIEVANSAIDDVFGDVTPVLLQKTRVPLRLPTYDPYSGDREQPLYAILEVADPTHYEIQIAWDKGCLGGNACHEGTLRGSTKPLVEEDGPRIPVNLEGGIKGYFIDPTCGAHCSDSSLGWDEGIYHYSISIKAGKKSILVKMANSAIVDAQKLSR